MNYFTSKTAEQLTLVSISHAREGKAGELKKACLDLIENSQQTHHTSQRLPIGLKHSHKTRNFQSN